MKGGGTEDVVSRTPDRDRGLFKSQTKGDAQPSLPDGKHACQVGEEKRNNETTEKTKTGGRKRK